MAIRPELIEISKAQFDRPDSYVLKGVVKESIPHGNIIRYTLSCGSVSLQADILFDSSLLFNDGETLYLSFKKDDCLPLD